MYENIKNWIEKTCKEENVKDINIPKMMETIKKGIKQIEYRSLFDKRFMLTDEISVLVYEESRNVEVYITIDGVISDFEYFKNTK